MEFAFKYGMWESLKHEQIPETKDLAAIWTGHTCLFQAKDILIFFQYIMHSPLI